MVDYKLVKVIINILNFIKIIIDIIINITIFLTRLLLTKSYYLSQSFGNYYIIS